jgi:hypothetical protein
MAKQVSTATKLNFGKRKVGRHLKRKSPKDKVVKQYKGQGR